MKIPAFKDNFSKQSDIYALYRPEYPDALFEYLAGLCKGHELAWDCGCGNGQAAIGLVKYFETVVATDPSEAQLENAREHERIKYKVELAEESDLNDHSTDLVAAANALHWFDREKFYKETRRVLKPGGILAAWAYALPEINTEVDAILLQLHQGILGKYWKPENHLVAGRYKNLDFPFDRLEEPEFWIEKEMNLDEFLGFLNTWSATQRYIVKNQENPVDEIYHALYNAWGSGEARKKVRWKLILRIGKV